MTDKICSEFGSDRQQEVSRQDTLNDLLKHLNICEVWLLTLQCTELVPAIAAGAIQWARTHWPVETICQDVQLCDATALTASEVCCLVMATMGSLTAHA